MKIAEKWLLSAALRRDKATTNPELTAAASQYATTGRLGLMYLFEHGISPYISYSESFEPLLGTDAFGKAFVPRTAEQVEAGVKYQPKGTEHLLTAAVFEITEQSRVGMTYHSMVDYTLKGETQIEGSGFGPFSGSQYDASLALKTPESVDFSITHALNADWTLYAGSTWTRWSRLEEIRAENKGVGGFLAGNLSSITEPQNWHDTWAHAVGAAYKLNPQWTLRAGLAVDQSPTNNLDRSPRIPTGDRTILSLGTAWSPNDDLTIDLAYSYLMEDDADIERGDYRATYKNTAHGLGTQVTYRF